MYSLKDYTAAAVHAAREAVANEWASNAMSMRTSDCYASHVTEERKEEALITALAQSEQIRKGELDHQFWCLHRILYHLLGESIPLLPKVRTEVTGPQPTYRIIRFYRTTDKGHEVIKDGLTRAEAEEHCRSPLTATAEFFDGFEPNPITRQEEDEDA